MSGLCYWCESRALIHCKICKRSFCKFCIKGGHLNDESKCVCFICGCYELTEVINENNGYLKDREMYDMLHRYEGLFSNDKLANSIHDLLINIDAIDNEKLPRLFDVIKMNIYSMLHDVQKIESMVNRAISEQRSNDVKNVLMPLMKVVMKHHVFKRLGRPQHCIVNEEPLDINNDDNYVDLMEHSRMEISKNSSDDNDYEPIQRSPECLADEDRLTSNFEINEAKEEEDNICDKRDLIRPDKLLTPKSLSLISTQMNQLNKIELQYNIKNSPNLNSEIFCTPSKENPLVKRKRSKRSLDIERRSVRLRSESNVIIPSFNALHSDLSQAMTVFKPVEGSFQSCPPSPPPHSPCKGRKWVEERIIPKKLSEEDLCRTVVEFKINSKKSTNDKSSPRESPRPIMEIKEEMSFELLFPSEINNQSSSSSSIDGRKSENLRKFSQVICRNKNSHLVSPAPIQYEKPFVLKDNSEKSVDCPDEELIKQPVSHKTWSWERRSLPVPKYVIPTKRKSIIGEDISRILNKTVIIPKPVFDSTLVVPVRGRPRLSMNEAVKRSFSPAAANIDSDEPKKKRGRPRKYFDFDCHTGGPSIGSQEDLRNSSDLSDSK